MKTEQKILIAIAVLSGFATLVGSIAYVFADGNQSLSTGSSPVPPSEVKAERDFDKSILKISFPLFLVALLILFLMHSKTKLK